MKKEIFISLFNNKILKSKVFDYVHYIHKAILKLNLVYKWDQLLYNPNLLAYHNILDQLVQYYKDYPIAIKNISKPLEIAISRGHLNIVEHFIDIYATKIDNSIESLFIDYTKKSLEISIKENQLTTIKSILEKVNHISDLLEKKLDDVDTIKSKVNEFDLIYLAYKYNQFEILKWLHINRIGLSLDESLLEVTVDQSNMEMFMWVIENALDSVGLKNAVYKVSSIGNLDLLKWLSDHTDAQFTDSVINYAAEFGHLHIIEWLHQNRTEGFSKLAMNFAAKSGHIHVIKWLLQNTKMRFRFDDLNESICFGSLDIVKWYFETIAKSGDQNSQKLVECMDFAIAYGQMDIVKWLHENRSTECSDSGLSLAYERGHYDIVKWLLSNKSNLWFTPLGKPVHFPTIKWIHENHTEFQIDYISYFKVFQIALKHNDIETIQWYYENDISVIDRYEWDDRDTKSDTLLHSPMEMVKWFHEKMPEYLEYELTEAAKSGNLEVFEWLLENQAYVLVLMLFDIAVENGHMDLVIWLHKNKKFFNIRSYRALDNASKKGNMDMVVWLYNNKMEGLSDKSLNWAAEYGHFEIVKWLHEKKYWGCSTDAVDLSYKNHHYHITQWLLENRTEGCSYSTTVEIIRDSNIKFFMLIAKNLDIDHINSYFEYTFNNFPNSEIFKWLTERYPECNQKLKDSNQNEFLLDLNFDD